MPLDDQTEMQPLPPQRPVKKPPAPDESKPPATGPETPSNTSAKEETPANPKGPGAARPESAPTVSHLPPQSPATFRAKPPVDPKSPATLPNVGQSSRLDGTVYQEDAEAAAAQRRSVRADEEDFVPRVSGYQMIRRLGQGTFGVVWHARDARTGVEVAIKFFARGAGHQWQMLQAEVMQLAKLHSDPGIVQLIDVEPDSDPPYFIMSYLPEGSLVQRLQKGPMPVDEAVRIFRQVAEAMAYVHAKGIRHCDLKPGNILLDARGRARVADFGQAHFSDDATPALGTYFYMAPEQADLSKQIPDTRWDVYGMGALLYSMLTGSPPREDTTLRQRLEGTLDLGHRLQRYRETVKSAPRPDKHHKIQGVDKELATILDGCLEIDPEKRLRDAGAILNALDQRDRIRRQRPFLIFALVAPLLFLLILGGIIMYQSRTVMDEFRRSQEEVVVRDNKRGAALVSSVVASQLKRRVDTIVRVAQQRMPLFYKGETTLPLERREEIAEGIKYLERNDFNGWAVADAKGTFVTGYNYSKDKRGPVEYFGTNFSWRQWFTGEPDRDRDKPLAERGRYASYWAQPGKRAEFLISDPYVSTSKDKCVGISAPILIDGKFVGVFLANLDLDSFNHWLKVAQFERGSAILLNPNGYCLFHSAEGNSALSVQEREHLEERVRPSAHHPMVSFADRSEVFQSVLQGKEGYSLDHFDPILENGRRYIASYAPIAEFGGGTVVQSDYLESLRSVRDLYSQLRLWGLILFSVAVILLLSLWTWFFRILKSEERPTHA